MKKFIIVLFTILLAASIAAQEKETTQERAFQFSFITPLGTNGMDSHLYTNTVSINAFGGYSYANTALELGGLYNINTGYTQGVQFGGIFNYSGDVRGAAQFAGIANISNNVKGFQGAGIVNIADTVSGTQFGGIANISKDITGFQAAGIINIAKKVEGVQFGLINYADEINGVPIGLISIVKEGGKREIEIAYFEAIDTTLNFKLGTDHFYTIFSAGANYFGDTNGIFGTGFGTQLNWNYGFSNQIEVMAYQLIEDWQFSNALNMLTQVKLLTSKQLVGGLNAFVGPTWNMTISQHKDENGNIGASLKPWSLWEKTTGNTHLNMWIGYSIGLSYRF